jgi:hypothetical protein
MPSFQDPSFVLSLTGSHRQAQPAITIHPVEKPLQQSVTLGCASGKTPRRTGDGFPTFAHPVAIHCGRDGWCVAPNSEIRSLVIISSALSAISGSIVDIDVDPRISLLTAFSVNGLTHHQHHQSPDS